MIVILFINKLENVKDTSKDSILVSLDVKALYTYIPNHEGIETVKETLNNQAKKPIATQVIIKFLTLKLTLHNFVFSGINYIQKKGRALFHNLACKSENLIYLLQCRICQIQYIGKSGTPFNIRLNNHRKDAKSQASILPCKHFNEQNCNSQQHAEFTLTEQIKKQTTTEETRTL